VQMSIIHQVCRYQNFESGGTSLSCIFEDPAWPLVFGRRIVIVVDSHSSSAARSTAFTACSLSLELKARSIAALLMHRSSS